MKIQPACSAFIIRCMIRSVLYAMICNFNIYISQKNISDFICINQKGNELFVGKIFELWKLFFDENSAMIINYALISKKHSTLVRVCVCEWLWFAIMILRKQTNKFFSHSPLWFACSFSLRNCFLAVKFICGISIRWNMYVCCSPHWCTAQMHSKVYFISV